MVSELQELFLHLLASMISLLNEIFSLRRGFNFALKFFISFCAARNCCLQAKDNGFECNFEFFRRNLR